MGWNLKHRPIRVSNGPGGGASMSALAHGALTGIEAGDKVASVSYGGVSMVYLSYPMMMTLLNKFVVADDLSLQNTWRLPHSGF